MWRTRLISKRNRSSASHISKVPPGIKTKVLQVIRCKNLTVPHQRATQISHEKNLTIINKVCPGDASEKRFCFLVPSLARSLACPLVACLLACLLARSLARSLACLLATQTAHFLILPQRSPLVGVQCHFLCHWAFIKLGPPEYNLPPKAKFTHF